MAEAVVFQIGDHVRLIGTMATGRVTGRGQNGLIVEMDRDGYLMEAGDGEWEVIG